MDNDLVSKSVVIFLQQNSQSIKPKSINFRETLNTVKINIAIIFEICLKKEQIVNINSNQIYRKDKQDGCGGVAIIIHKSIKACACSINVPNLDIEILHVKVVNCCNLQNIVGI